MGQIVRHIRKVLLIYPFTVIDKINVYGVAYDPAGNIIKGDKIEPSLGLGYISSYLQKYMPSIEVEILDANAMAIKKCIKDNRVDIPELWRIAKEYIENYNPDMVGISCFSLVTAFSTQIFARIVKEINPTIYTVIGGNYANTSYDEALNEGNYIDFVVFSEGEKVLLNLISAINNKKDLVTVKGIAYKNNKKELVKTEEENIIEDIDTIPLCDRKSIDMDFYSTNGNYFVYRFLDRDTTKIAPIMASRGCNRGCKFCTAYLIWGGKLRYRNPDLVVDEMIKMKEIYDINTFCFFDANILGHGPSFLKLANEIRRRLPGIVWVSIEGMEVANLTEEIIGAIYDSGCKWFVLPFESGSNETLGKIGKKHKAEMIYPVIENIRKYPDTWISGNLITGLAFETKEDIEKSYKYAETLDMDWLYVYRFIPFPGIAMYEECLSSGYVKKYGWSLETLGDLWKLETPNFSSNYVAERNYDFNITYNFLKNRNIKLRPEQAIKDFQYVLDRANDHAVAMYSMARAYREMKKYDESEKWLLKCIKTTGGNNVDLDMRKDNDMESISKSFVVIGKNIKYKEYLDRFGINLNAEMEELRKLKKPC